MGMSKDQIETAIGIPLQPSLTGEPHYFSTLLVPQPYAGAESYLLLVLPEAGLCRISMAGKNVSTDGYGVELRLEYWQLRHLVSGVYGEWDELDYLFAGSIWDEPRDWMRALERDERRLSTTWSAPDYSGPSSEPPPLDAPEGSTMRNNVRQVVLSVRALSGDTGYLTLSYWFENDAACTAEMDQEAKQAAQDAQDVF